MATGVTTTRSKHLVASVKVQSQQHSDVVSSILKNPIFHLFFDFFRQGKETIAAAFRAKMFDLKMALGFFCFGVMTFFSLTARL